MLYELFKDHYEDTLELLNCLKVGVYITDGNGVTLMVNDDSCKTGGLTREDVIHRSMVDLEREGYVRESVTLKVIESGNEEVMIQDLGDGNKIFCTSHPIYKGDKIAFVVTTEKDITENHILQKLLQQHIEVSEKYEKELEYLRQENLWTTGSIVANDSKMRALMEQAKRVATLDTTVLLMGESGTGKEVLANFICSKSSRSDKPFIKVNCAAIPENLLESEMFGYAEGAFTGAKRGGKAGYFELADGGTLFLDEIGELPIGLQSKLLRVIQEGEVMNVGGTKPISVDVRLIAATNTHLTDAMSRGDFREDLYYRLAVMPMVIPPLRERRSDIVPLARLFVDILNKKYALKKSLDPGVGDILEQYDWPGNARELQNIIERCMISYDSNSVTPFQVSRLIQPQDQGFSSHDDPVSVIESGEKTLHELLADYERMTIQSALHRSKSISEASEKLGINRTTLWRQIKKHNIDVS